MVTLCKKERSFKNEGVTDQTCDSDRSKDLSYPLWCKGRCCRGINNSFFASVTNNEPFIDIDSVKYFMINIVDFRKKTDDNVFDVA